MQYRVHRSLLTLAAPRSMAIARRHAHIVEIIVDILDTQDLQLYDTAVHTISVTLQYRVAPYMYTAVHTRVQCWVYSSTYYTVYA